MSLVVVEAEFTLADPANSHRIAETADIQRATREEEEGCLAYCFAADPVVPGRVQVYELWESEKALDDHLKHPNYFAMREALGKIGVVGATSRKLRVDAEAPVYDENRIPSGYFD